MTLAPSLFIRVHWRSFVVKLVEGYTAEESLDDAGR